MSAKILDQYIKTYRLRSGLSQGEVAFLLGGSRTGGSKISRYELGRRMLPLETALGLETVLGAPVRDLFRGENMKVEESIRHRAKILRVPVENEPESAAKLRRRATLQRIIGDPLEKGSGRI